MKILFTNGYIHLRTTLPPSFIPAHYTDSCPLFIGVYTRALAKDDTIEKFTARIHEFHLYVTFFSKFRFNAVWFVRICIRGIENHSISIVTISFSAVLSVNIEPYKRSEGFVICWIPTGECDFCPNDDSPTRRCQPNFALDATNSGFDSERSGIIGSGGWISWGMSTMMSFNVICIFKAIYLFIYLPSTSFSLISLHCHCFYRNLCVKTIRAIHSGIKNS